MRSTLYFINRTTYHSMNSEKFPQHCYRGPNLYEIGNIPHFNPSKHIQNTTSRQLLSH